MATQLYRATNLRAILDASGTRYDWLAKRIGMNPVHLTRVMDRSVRMPAARAQAVADALRLPLFVLFELPDASKMDATDIDLVAQTGASAHATALIGAED